MLFWKNPEFVRHVRAELRPARAVTAAALSLVICTLVGLSCWASTDPMHEHDFFPLFYLWMMVIQFVVLAFWGASSCGHAISRERELKTYDFLRTTRLTAPELIVGKVLGVPILAYFTIGCTAPVSVVMGIIAGYRVGSVLLTYILLLAMGLFVSVVALWISMLVGSASARAAGFLAVFPILFTYSLGYSPFHGFGALSVIPALFAIYRPDAPLGRVPPTVLGLQLSYPLLTLVMYFLFGSWFFLMLNRNFKKDMEAIRLLSRWQAVGFAAFLNFLFYAFLDPKSITLTSSYNALTAGEVSTAGMAFNAVILIAIGMATLSPHEKLKVWWRKHGAREAGYFSESGPPWPWLVPAAGIAYAMLLLEVLFFQFRAPVSEWHLGIAAAEMGVALVFVIRDISFLQWAALTRMKHPVMKGFLYLWLYYTAAGILALVSGTVAGQQAEIDVLGSLTPYTIFMALTTTQNVWPGVMIGVVMQLVLSAVLLRAIDLRLRRPALVPVLSEG